MASQDITRRLTQVDDVDKAIIKLVVEDPIITNIKISEIINLDRIHVGQRRNSYPVQRIITEYMKPAKKLLEEVQPEAIRVCKEILKDKSLTPRDRLKAAELLLTPLIKNPLYGMDEGEMTLKWGKSVGDIKEKLINELAGIASSN